MVLDGLSVRETAVLLGVPEGTVKTRARRARIAEQLARVQAARQIGLTCEGDQLEALTR